MDSRTKTVQLTRLDGDMNIKLNSAENGDTVFTQPATQKQVAQILGAAPGPDTRSGFTWLRLPNGDLILGVFPQGALYHHIESELEI